ncbi:PilZ domain-containing protein [Celeribacter sp. ULVN23_4]
MCVPDREIQRHRRVSARLRRALAPVRWLRFRVVAVILAVILVVISTLLGFGGLGPGVALAAPSCGLENWLTALNQSANGYISALGTADEHESARRFRSEMERYGRDQLLQQIREADLGTNEQPLLDFITARRYLLNLEQDNWGQMAQRYGQDPRFGAQADSLSRYLSATPCDPDAPDHLNAPDAGDGGMFHRVAEGIEEITELVQALAQTESGKPPPIDPQNFDEFRMTPHAPPDTAPPKIKLNASGNVAFVLGMFTFITAISVWLWMRYSIVQRRALRYPCALPVVIFDGILPVIGEILDLSQVGCKIESSHALDIRQKVRLTCGPMDRKARVIWCNNHFIGLKFERALNEAEFKTLLGPHAAQVAAERAAAAEIAPLDETPQAAPEEAPAPPPDLAA